MLAPPNLSLLLVMACFWLVFLLVSSQLVKPLGMLLDERERQISGSQQSFERAQQALRDTLARCERELAEVGAEAQRERAAQRTAGESARRAALDAARLLAQERLTALTSALETASADARHSLRERSQELARELASRLIGRRVA
jgi:F0F1-type ATP synthase membrane subunit b/b'